MCVCAYGRAYECAYVHVQSCRCACKYMCVYVHLPIYTYRRTCLCILLCMPYVYAYACVCVCVWLHVPSAKPAEQVDCYVTCARRLSTLPTACSTTSEAWSTVLCVCGHAVMPSRRPASVRRPQDCHGLTPTRALKRISPRQPGAKHLPNSHGSMVD